MYLYVSISIYLSIYLSIYIYIYIGIVLNINSAANLGKFGFIEISNKFPSLL